MAGGGMAGGGTELPARAARGGATAGGQPPAKKPLLRAVGSARMAPSPSAVERARSGLQAAEESAAAANEEARRAAAELADAASEISRLGDETRELRRRLELAEAGLKDARKRHELAAALAQQTARAADRQRRREVLARERVLRLSNTPEA
jgi:chromosome segregation ATPase